MGPYIQGGVMKDLLLFALLVWGTWFIFQTKIFAWLRSFLERKWPIIFHFLTCPPCLGFWVSVFWSLVTKGGATVFPELPYGPGMNLLVVSLYLLANGIIGSALCTFLEMMFRILNRIIEPEKRI